MSWFELAVPCVLICVEQRYNNIISICILSCVIEFIIVDCFWTSRVRIVLLLNPNIVMKQQGVLIKKMRVFLSKP